MFGAVRSTGGRENKHSNNRRIVSLYSLFESFLIITMYGSRVSARSDVRGCLLDRRKPRCRVDEAREINQFKHSLPAQAHHHRTIDTRGRRVLLCGKSWSFSSTSFPFRNARCEYFRWRDSHIIATCSIASSKSVPIYSHINTSSFFSRQITEHIIPGVPSLSVLLLE